MSLVKAFVILRYSEIYSIDKYEPVYNRIDSRYYITKPTISNEMVSHWQPFQPELDICPCCGHNNTQDIDYKEIKVPLYKIEEVEFEDNYRE